MSETTEAAQAQKLLESLGYTVFKGAAPPACRTRSFTTARSFRRRRWSTIAEETAHAIIGRNMRALNSKLNWRVLEQAYRATLDLELELKFG